MISDEHIQKALDFLRDSSPQIADARYHKTRTEELRKAVWAEVRRECDGPQSQRDAEAYASKAYREHVNQMAEAAREYELLYAQRKAAEAKIEAWRSFSANQRGMERVR